MVIPTSLQKQVINIYHEGHLGIVKTKQLLRSRVWFPVIDKSVERKIASCIPCQASTNSSQREPLKMSPTPNGPWLQVSADFCGPFPTGETVLVVLDAYSKYPEVEIVPSIAAKDTMPVLERIFATHGIPKVLKTDYGPTFQGHAFQSFAKAKGFTHRKITPLWPVYRTCGVQSNSREIPFSHYDSIHLFPLSPRLQFSLQQRKPVKNSILSDFTSTPTSKCNAITGVSITLP